MAKYRKKPVVIEAWQVPLEGDIMTIATEMGKSYVGGVFPSELFDLHQGTYLFVEPNKDGYELYVHTLEGQMHAPRGSWIIKGVKGELYCCADDIFRQTYEPVNGD